MRRCWYCFLLLLLFLPPSLLHGSFGSGSEGSWDVRLSSVQSWAFPILLFALSLWGRRILKLPLWIPAVAFLGWMSTLAYQRIALASGNELRLTITAAPHDPLGVRGRALERYSAMIAQLFDLPLPQHLDTVVPTARGAKDSVASVNDNRLLVVAQNENWDLRIGRGAKLRRCRFGATRCEALSDLARRFQVIAENEAYFVEPPASEYPLMMVLRPEVVHFPAEPVDLSAQSLEWITNGLQFAAGLRRLPAPQLTNEVMTEDAFEIASSIQGVWKSFTPLGAASAMLGTFRLIESDAPSRSTLGDSVSDLQRAMRLARRQYDPELFAMILNNLAISRLYEAEFVTAGTRVQRSMEMQLEEASGFVDAEGRPVLGARVALLNLAILRGLNPMAGTSR